MSPDLPLDDESWLEFRAALTNATGVPLSSYKEPQMKRRLANLMRRNGYDTWLGFAAAIQQNADLRAQVEDTLTINVSEFFRQPERFLELLKTVLPRLLSEQKTLKIWSAGCSIGCEPYTLALLLEELDPVGHHQILATDVDLQALTRARSGAGYLPAEVRAVPHEYLARYFAFNGETYRVSDALKRRVTFRRHDLLSDGYPEGFNVILCRNVVIYFTDSAKRHIFDGFSRSLKPGGLLFVGGSEMIMRSTEFGLRVAGTSFYRKAA